MDSACVCLYTYVCTCTRVSSIEWKPWVGLLLSGCCVRCQQPVEILRLLLNAPCFMSESYVNLVNAIAYLLYMYWVVDSVCVCVCVKLVCACVCSIEWSFEWVLCCLDVASVVSSLSRCCVFCQVPCVSWVNHNYVNLVNVWLQWWTPCVCVRVYMYVCMCVTPCVHVCSIEWKLQVGLMLSGCCVRCQQPFEMLCLYSGIPCFRTELHVNLTCVIRAVCALSCIFYLSLSLSLAPLSLSVCEWIRMCTCVHVHVFM